MAATIPTREPIEVRAGDTILFTKSLADYSAADGWVLTYYIAGPVPIDAWAATADGSGFSVTIAADVSANYQKGDYWIEGKVAKAGEVFTVYAAALRVLPGFSSANVGAGFDGRTYWETTRDTIKATLAGLAQFPESGMTIMGERSYELRTYEDAIKLLGFCESKVAEEQRAAAIARGERTGVYFKFTTPR